eukprot:scaffold23479_cov143-Cylindrotheca_fusiformis.AAC.20
MTFQSNYSDSLGDSPPAKRQRSKRQGHSTLNDDGRRRLAHKHDSQASRDILANSSLMQMSPLLSHRSQFPSDSSLLNMSHLQGAQNTLQQGAPLAAVGAMGTGNLLNRNTSKTNAAVGLMNLVSSAASSLSPNAFDSSSLSTESSMSSGTSSAAVRGNMMDSNNRFIAQAYLEIMAKKAIEETLRAPTADHQSEKQQAFASAIPSQPVAVTETRKRPMDEARINQTQRPIKKRVADQSKIDSSISFPRQATYDQKWNQHYNELVAFKEEHGHCRVPQKCEQQGSLSQWVKRQRYHRKHKPGIISEDRIRMLDEIGFVWDAQELVWQTRFAELLEFKQSHGHCSVPYKYPLNQKLATWIKCQRRQYQLLQAGKRSHLTPKRIRLLEEAGFVWNPRKSVVNDDGG